MNRLFILREPVHFTSMVNALAANWQVFAAGKTPLSVTVAPYRKTRTSEQNALMWVWLGMVARDAWVAGRQFSDETWHEHAKREFLPERNARGDEKWQWLPSGERICVMSTTRLNTAEMSAYMEALSAFFVTELGVNLDQ
jgi:hypothetical protein